jgi:hypothetical protein
MLQVDIFMTIEGEGGGFSYILANTVRKNKTYVRTEEVF